VVEEVRMIAMPQERIGEMLLAACLINQQQLINALSEQRRSGDRIGSALVKLGYLSEASLAVFLSKRTHLPCINVAAAVVSPEALRLVPRRAAEARGVLPLKVAHGVVYLAVATPLAAEELEALGLPGGSDVVQMIAPEFRLREAIAVRYGG
jgi:type IV pilus assembly protein PilB